MNTNSHQDCDPWTWEGRVLGALEPRILVTFSTLPWHFLLQQVLGGNGVFHGTGLTFSHSVFSNNENTLPNLNEMLYALFTTCIQKWWRRRELNPYIWVMNPASVPWLYPAIKQKYLMSKIRLGVWIFYSTPSLLKMVNVFLAILYSSSINKNKKMFS